MGAGGFPAGGGSCGLDPITPSSRVIPSLAAAISYRPDTRTFVMADDGQLVEMHPVDQSVLVAVTVALGSLPSAPETGLDRTRIRNATKASLPQVIVAAVKDALRSLIDAGLIEFLGAPLHPQAYGRAIFYVDYLNLKQPDSRPRRVTANG